MQGIKYRSWVEGERISYMNYNIEFAGGLINDIFATSGQEPQTPYGSKITYMQYTGLNDEIGNEIYRKDIVERNGIKYLVEFELGSFVLVRTDDTDMYKEFEDCWNDDVYPLIQLYWNSEGQENCLPGVKKIGNVFENPELLTQ